MKKSESDVVWLVPFPWDDERQQIRAVALWPGEAREVRRLSRVVSSMGSSTETQGVRVFYSSDVRHPEVAIVRFFVD